MSICPKNKSSKARRDKRRANWKMSAMNLLNGKMWSTYDATQSLQACGSYIRRKSSKED